MILDSQNLFSDDQAITASAASTNVIDLGAPGTPVGAYSAQSVDAGNSGIRVLIQVTEDFATLTSLTVSVQTDNDVAWGSAATILSTPAIAAASLVAGYKFAIIEVPIHTTERYLRLYYTVGGSNATAGKITASVVGAVQMNG